MSSTIRLLPIARRQVSGESNGPQGEDGTAVLAREAWLAMLASEWEADGDAAAMPVHEFKRSRPTGQAYKAVWGYDAAARSQRSCCGAECYTYMVPADALDTTNQDGAAAVESVSVRLAGDRYLDKGVRLWCELSSSPTPSPLSVAIASGDGVARLATQNQLDADGSPLAPNKRSGTEETVALPMASAAPAAYLHVHIFLGDYLGVRGGWIEGGAMFADEAAEVAFSRDVEADENPESGSAALDIGRVSFGTPTELNPNRVPVVTALATLPRVSVWQNFLISATPATFNAFAGDSFALRVANLLAFVASSPSLWAPAPAEEDDANAIAESATLDYGQTGLLKVSADSIGFCCLCAHGLTGGRTFRGMRFQSALPASVPYRLLAYGISADLAIASSAPGSTLRFATPLAHWADILSRDFREGRATSLNILTDSGLSAQTMPAAPVSATESVAVKPLAARSVSSAISRVPFDSPFVSGELSSVILALIPDGAPANPESQATTINATATRSVSASYPVSATRQQLTSAITPGTLKVGIQLASTVGTAVLACVPGFGVVYESGTYKWNSAAMGMSSVNRSKFSTARLSGVQLSFSRNGKTYTFDSANNLDDILPNFTFKVDFHMDRPSAADGFFFPWYSAYPSGSFSIVAHAADGSAMPVTITLPGAGGYEMEFKSTAGFISPAAWDAQSQQYAYNRGYDDPSDGYQYSARATLAGYAYSFASSSNETAVAAVTQSGTITFVRDGVTYSAQYSDTAQTTLGLASKTTGTSIAVGDDTTETATAYGNVAAIGLRLRFAGSNGSVLWALAELPASQIRGDIPYQAKSAYHGTAQGVGTVYDDGADTGSGAAYRVGLHGTASVNETYAQATIDPGLITLYE